MGAQYSHLVFCPPTEPTYTENIEGFISIPHYETKLIIPAIYIEQKGASNAESPITIIYSHDNNENLASILIWVKFLRDRLKVILLLLPFSILMQRSTYSLTNTADMVYIPENPPKKPFTTTFNPVFSF